VNDQERQAHTARKVLLLLSELHLRGLQLLRACVMMNSSGTSWRCSIAPVSLVSIDNGALLVQAGWDSPLVAHYTSASGANTSVGKMPHTTRRAPWPASSSNDSQQPSKRVAVPTGSTPVGTWRCCTSRTRIISRTRWPTGMCQRIIWTPCRQFPARKSKCPYLHRAWHVTDGIIEPRRMINDIVK